MLAHVRAEPRGAAIELHLAHEAAFNQGVEAVIDRGHGNVRHAALGADEDLLGGGVVTLLQQHVIDVLALGREPEPTRRQAFAQAAARFFVLDRIHHRGKINASMESVKI